MNENNSLITIPQLGNTLTALANEASSQIGSLIESDNFEVVFSTASDIGGDLLDSLKIINALKIVSSVPTKLFMHKFERYCKGLCDIPVGKRQDYINKVGKATFNKESVFVLNMINKIEELSKITILVTLFEAKLDKKIDDDMYRRLMVLTDRTLLFDLEYLANNITDEPFYITTVSEEGLLSNGWIIYEGQTWGTATEDGGNIYKYTSTANLFVNLTTDLF